MKFYNGNFSEEYLEQVHMYIYIVDKSRLPIYICMYVVASNTLSHLLAVASHLLPSVARLVKLPCSI